MSSIIQSIRQQTENLSPKVCINAFTSHEAIVLILVLVFTACWRVWGELISLSTALWRVCMRSMPSYYNQRLNIRRLRPLWVFADFLSRSKAAADGAVIWAVNLAVVGRVTRSAYGVITRKPYDPSLPEHQGRNVIESDEGQRVDGYWSEMVGMVSEFLCTGKPYRSSKLLHAREFFWKQNNQFNADTAQDTNLVIPMFMRNSI